MLMICMLSCAAKNDDVLLSLVMATPPCPLLSTSTEVTLLFPMLHDPTVAVNKILGPTSIRAKLPGPSPCAKSSTAITPLVIRTSMVVRCFFLYSIILFLKYSLTGKWLHHLQKSVHLSILPYLLWYVCHPHIKPIPLNSPLTLPAFLLMHPLFLESHSSSH